jgi:hypothetical protein
MAVNLFSAGSVLSSYSEEQVHQSLQPGDVNKIYRGQTLLSAAVGKDASSEYLCWLIDDMGAKVNLKIDASGCKAIYHAKSVRVVSLLMEKGADLRLIDDSGRTVLQYFARGEPNIPVFKRLLKNSDVALLNSEACGRTALRYILESKQGTPATRTQMVRLLLRYGANPTLGYLQPYERSAELIASNRAAIALVDESLREFPRCYSLWKTRHQIDILYTLAKAAAKGGATEEDRRATCVLKAPVFLKRRVLAGKALPCAIQEKKRDHRPWEQSGAKAEEEKIFQATLAYVLYSGQGPDGDDEGAAAAGGGGGGGGMPFELFVELMQMMTSEWHPMRGPME